MCLKKLSFYLEKSASENSRFFTLYNEAVNLKLKFFNVLNLKIPNI